jgi:hypothetical protein
MIHVDDGGCDVLAGSLRARLRGTFFEEPPIFTVTFGRAKPAGTRRGGAPDLPRRLSSIQSGR